MTLNALIVSVILNYLICNIFLRLLSGKNCWYDSLFIVIVLRTIDLLLKNVIDNELLTLLISTNGYTL